MTQLATQRACNTRNSGGMDFPVKSGAVIHKGAFVWLDAGYLAGGAPASGKQIVGKASASVSNAGADGAVMCHVEFPKTKVICPFIGDANNLFAQSDMGGTAYILDDQTVTTVSSGHSTAGIPWKITTANGVQTVWVEIDAYRSEASGPMSLTEINNHIKTAQKVLRVPLGSFVNVAGTQLTAFADGASAQPGLEFTASKGMSIRWNNHAAPLAVMSQVEIPNDMDVTANATLKVLASKVGATVGDAVTFTVGAFNQVAGALHDADTNYGGATSAMTGDATSKTDQLLSRTLATADLPAVRSNVTLTLKPTDGTLGTDDVCVHAVWIEYKGKALAS